jgi:hypothetical protein
MLYSPWKWEYQAVIIFAFCFISRVKHGKGYRRLFTEGWTLISKSVNIFFGLSRLELCRQVQKGRGKWCSKFCATGQHRPKYKVKHLVILSLKVQSGAEWMESINNHDPNLTG